MVPKRVLLLILFQIAASAAATEGYSSTVAIPKAGCPRKCDQVDIPYPFGIGTNCSITCNDTTDPPKPFIGVSNIEILDVSLVDHELSMHIYMVDQCYEQSGDYSSTSLDLPFLFSAANNKFTIVGCSTLAYVIGQNAKAALTQAITCPTATMQVVFEGTELRSHVAI